AAGRAETYQLFVTSLDQDAQRQIDRWIDLDRFFEHLTAATESFSQEERVSLLKEVCALPAFSNRFDAYGDLFKKLIATSLLTVDTVIAHSDAFTHLLPRWGTTSAELAEILMSQGKIQQSIPYWEQAIAIAGEHKTTNFVNIHQRRAA